MTTPSLRARARAGERLLGVLVRMPAEELVEMAAVTGFDFILIDCEHGPSDVVSLRHHMALAGLHGVPVLVRTGSGESALVLRALDQGAEGVLSPHTDSVAHAQAVVASSHYPPLGRRGFATYSRAGRFGTVPAAAHREKYRDHTLVLGMIESPDGVQAVDDIVAVEGLDGLMIGPSDLAATSGPADLPVSAASARVHRALASGGKLRVDIVNDADAAQRVFEEGANLVVYNLAHTLMAHLARLADVR